MVMHYVAAKPEEEETPQASSAKRRPTPDLMAELNAPNVLDDLFGTVAGGPETLEVKAIRVDGGTQMRAGTNWETVREYADAMREGVTFPPILVFHDGETYWLADGFHRLAAHQVAYQRPDAPTELSKPTIAATVRSGTRRDAILHAAAANAAHGLRRTNEDKRRAVETLLRDEEWQKWGNREIARKCAVDEKTVRTLREKLESSAEVPQIDTERTVQRGGQTYTQNTANIGTNRASTIHWNSISEIEAFLREWQRRGQCDVFGKDVANEETLLAAIVREAGERNLAANRATAFTALGNVRNILVSEQIAAQRQAQRETAAATPYRIMGTPPSPSVGAVFNDDPAGRNQRVNAYTWEGYADWDTDDINEYEAVVDPWRLAAHEFNPLTELERITRWRVAARLAGERQDNLTFSLQDRARRLRMHARYNEAQAAATVHYTPVLNTVSAPASAYTPNEKPLAEWDDADWAAYETQRRAAQIESVVEVKPTLGQLEEVVREVHATFYTEDHELRRAAQDMRAGAEIADGAFWHRTVRACTDLGWTFSDGLLANAIQRVANELDAAKASSVALPTHPVTGIPIPTMPIMDTTQAPDPEIVHPLDCYDNDKASPAHRRMERLWDCKRELRDVVNETFKRFGDLTGRHSMALEPARLINAMMKVLDEEMDALQHQVEEHGIDSVKEVMSTEAQ